MFGVWQWRWLQKQIGVHGIGFDENVYSYAVQVALMQLRRQNGDSFVNNDEVVVLIVVYYVTKSAQLPVAV